MDVTEKSVETTTT